ncbi:MAG TPA: bifunctional DNA primase/polymerase, partial [Thermaerobacter sp.]
MLRAALAAIERGWSIIPVRGKDPAFDLLPRRRGRAVWKPFQRRRPSPATIRKWFRSDPSIGFGVVTGSVSGIVVLDVDPRNGGDIAGKPIPPTPAERTPSGGWHFYFRDPGGVKGHVELAPGLELIGEGSYVVCSPSPGYTWYELLTPDDVEPADCPAWLLSMLQAKARVSGSTSQVSKILGRSEAKPKTQAPRAAWPIRGDALLAWCRRLDFGIAAAAFLGLPTDGLAEHGKTSAFLCRLPGHDERRPSASL